MLEFKVSKQAKKLLEKIPKKHVKQLHDAISRLCIDPTPHDSISLKGGQDIKGIRRLTAGEYRIIYKIENNELYVDVIGKRNDSEVYKIYKNMARKT